MDKPALTTRLLNNNGLLHGNLYVTNSEVITPTEEWTDWFVPNCTMEWQHVIDQWATVTESSNYSQPFQSEELFQGVVAQLVSSCCGTQDYTAVLHGRCCRPGQFCSMLSMSKSGAVPLGCSKTTVTVCAKELDS